MDNAKKARKRLKMRYAVLRDKLSSARYEVIDADIEITFLKRQKEIDPDFRPLGCQYDEALKKAMDLYEYHMKRLAYFKELKKIYDASDDVDAIAAKVMDTTPDTLVKI